MKTIARWDGDFNPKLKNRVYQVIKNGFLDPKPN